MLGGWIGRVAARYRMSVEEFAAAHELDLQTGVVAGWLLMPALRERSVDAVAALTRISKARIKGIDVPPAWTGAQHYFCYCPRCVFLNPLDVTAPIWKAEWLDPNLAACPTHTDEFRRLRSSSVLACKNFDQLLALVSRQERVWRNGTYASRASVVR